MKKQRKSKDAAKEVSDSGIEESSDANDENAHKAPQVNDL